MNALRWSIRFVDTNRLYGSHPAQQWLSAVAGARSVTCAEFTQPETAYMPRQILAEGQIHPSIRDTIASRHADTVRQVQAAIARDDVVVVGMALNPWPRMARRALRSAGIGHTYLEYGSYFNQWRRRNALKMWTGWPTFPMVFVKGMLVGGASDLQRLLGSGELQRLLAGSAP